LSVEEQFYVVWPSLILLTLALGLRAGWSRRRALLTVAGLVVAGSFAWSVATAGEAYFSSPARAWELGAGALLALFPAARSSAAVRRLLGVLGGVGLAVSVVLIGPATPVPGYAAALPVAATVALLISAPAALGWKPLRFLGQISYSLYLWHWPVLILVADLPGGTTLPATVACVALALVLSVASYRWVESPVRRSRWLDPGDDRPTVRRSVVGPAWALTVVVALSAAFVLTGTGRGSGEADADGQAPTVRSGEPLPDLGPVIAEGVARTAWPVALGDVTEAGAPEWIRDGCLDVGDRNQQRCVYGPKHAPVSVALLGDSVGVSWMPALRAAGGDDWRIHVLTRRQCPLVLVPADSTRAVSASCAAHQQYALEQVRRLRPDVVVVSQRYGGMTSAQWEAGTVRALTALAGLSARVVVLEPPPDTGNLQKCHTRLSTPAQCVEPLTVLHRDFAAAEQRATRQTDARFVETTDWFCLGGRCPAVIAGLPVHFDGEHLTAAYARYLGPYLRAAIR
ncbi:MAG: acyltransferase family protein, partial [Mycobacteriales bacterium]